MPPSPCSSSLSLIDLAKCSSLQDLLSNLGRLSESNKQILVQSLEVVACFSNSIRGGNILSVGESLTKQLLDTASDVADGKDLYHMLLGCIVNAESKLANGYLACKALRLLALDHPGIKEQMKLDINAKQCIGNAYQVGQVRHTLLKDESYQLWQTVCQQ